MDEWMKRRGHCIKMVSEKYAVEPFDVHYHRMHFGWSGHVARMGAYDENRMTYQTLTRDARFILLKPRIAQLHYGIHPGESGSSPYRAPYFSVSLRRSTRSTGSLP